MGVDENTSSGGLEQSDILSDKSPFPGDNIDAKISSVGGSGVDWSSKTAEIAQSNDTGGATVSVSGSGYLTGYLFHAKATANLKVDIDGTNQFLSGNLSDGDIYSDSLQHRFDSGFTIGADGTASSEVIVGYVLD